MKPCLYVSEPYRAHHKQWVREAAGALPVVFEEECTEAQRAQAFACAEIVFGEPEPETLRAAKALRWIQISWAGADIYTTAAWFPQDVQLTCATGTYGGTIAEYLFGVILGMYRHLPQYTRQQADGIWKPQFPGMGLEGRTVLIVGAGDIGTEFAKRLRPFEPARILGVRRTRRETPPEFDEMYTMQDLPGLWGQADVVVCSLPNTPKTRGMLDERTLRAMKPDALLVNVGRGTLLDPDVLAEVLRSGHLLGAVLDVVPEEPFPAGHPLWRMDNVILTPHIAGIGFGNVPETEDKIVRLSCENLRRYLHGEPLINRVYFETGYRAL